MTTSAVALPCGNHCGRVLVLNDTVLADAPAAAAQRAHWVVRDDSAICTGCAAGADV